MQIFMFFTFAKLRNKKNTKYLTILFLFYINFELSIIFRTNFKYFFFIYLCCYLFEDNRMQRMVANFQI